MKGRTTSLVALGMAFGFVLGAWVAGPRDTQAAVRNQYKVERGGMQGADGATLQDLLDQRAAEGWFLQALDHGTLVFRKAGGAAAATPSPSPEP